MKPNGPITIALAGNPNCGKTTLFNALTRSRQRVGNWPGVTVERMEGFYRHQEQDICVVDLPGIYSFSTSSIDESISRNYILRNKPDVVINIVDATNLERNLYLTTQLLEIRVPVVVALNMIDIARHRRIRIEVEHLARHLGCRVVPMVASRDEGIAELKDAVAEAAAGHPISATRVSYDPVVEQAIGRLLPAVRPYAGEHRVDERWLAIKLIEQDELAHELTRREIEPQVHAEVAAIEKHTGENITMVMADGRYGFIHGLARDVVHRGDEIRKTVSDAIDRVALSNAAGIPLFLLVMYAVFMITINAGKPFIDFFDILCGTIFVDGLRALLAHLHAPAFVVLLLADGVGAGLQTVATFIPPIALIFLCLAILEDSGYMARGAFVMDRLLNRIGLPGKAFLPLVIGFGCNVPGIMAARTLDRERDRILTIMLNPFMSCGARLPVYTLFAVAFFPGNGGLVVFGLYLTGIALAVMTGLLFQKTILRGDASAFVMELPPYHLPTFRGILYHTWHRLKSFILRAGQIIVLAVVVLSLLGGLGSDGRLGSAGADDSLLAAAGRAVVPVFRPMGLDENNWPAAVGLLTGLLAKEAVVGTLDALYAQAAPDVAAFDLKEGLRDAFRAIPAGYREFAGSVADPLGVLHASRESAESARARLGVRAGTAALLKERFGSRAAACAYLLFVLIYAPCIAAIGAIARETNWRWAVFAVTYLTGLAWVTATVFYQTVRFLDDPGGAVLWLGVCGLTISLFVVALRLWSSRYPNTEH